MKDVPLLKLWAKLGLGKYPDQSHPVVCHLLDVGHACLSLWNQALGEQARRHWSRAIGVDEDVAGRWIAFWAAAHDIGKVSPSFQFKVKDAKTTLRREGFAVGDGRGDWPHAKLSAVYLQQELVSPTGDAWPAVSANVASAVAAVVGGHHGVIPGSADIPRSRRTLGTGNWDEARSRIMCVLADEFGVIGAAIPREPKPADAGFWLFLAGLISVADWIGSNAKFFQDTDGNWAGPNVVLDDYRIQSRERAERAVRELGFGRWTPRQSGPLPFRSVHPGITTPRPLQDRCVEIAQGMTEPQLVLIEAPMGEGKTEAAVYLADHATHVLGCRGLYIALPTQATSNQMFGRIHKWLQQRYDLEAESQRLNLQLLHGRTGFSDAFCELLRLADIDEFQGTSATRSSGDQTKLRAHVVAESWFAQNRKQQLLAPFGVGTIDQLLLAVLQTKHHFVRLFGLAGRTVVLDEVHAYDAYMTTLMERLLQWLAGLGCPVVLLSATLPSERRRKLIEAYTGCIATIPEDSYPRITVAKRAASDVESHSVETDDARRLSINVSWIVDDELIARLREVLAGGGCIGIVCNTVSRSQELYRALAAEFAPQGVHVGLFHARFPVADRMRIEGEVLASLGPPIDNTRRLSQSILVATQVIEQSLDLDFDLLISEVAPIDLILQRAGRLHRHQGRPRPERLRTPRLWLMQPELKADDIPNFGAFQSGLTNSGKYRPGVYDRHILLRTWLALRDELGDGNILTLPDDLEPLVEAVYSATRPASDGDACDGDAWDNELSRTFEGLQQAIGKSESKASAVRVPPPDADDLLERSTPELDEDNPDVHRDLQAVTREGDPSITLVLLYQQGDVVSLDPVGALTVDLESPSRPSATQTRLLLERSVAVSNRFWFGHFVAHDVPAGWRKSGALGYARPVRLNASGVYAAGDRQLRFDVQLGLLFEREES